MFPEDLTRFLREEKWFFTPDNESIRTAVNDWCDEKRLKENSHIGAWNTLKVTDMSNLFYRHESFNDDISAWDVSNVTNMEHMFAVSRSFNQPLEAWNVSNVTSMWRMFCGAISFNQPLGAWKVSKVMDMAYMFSGAKSFNQSLSNWTISNETQRLNMLLKTPCSLNKHFHPKNLI